jgi:SAM-dependent MidA family methyltransferase
VTPVEAVVRERIAAHGPLSFRDVMQLALYHPEHGYYSNLRGFGADGDFITSPETHPAFGFLLARLVADVWQALDRPRPLRALELGPGSGGLAASLLPALRADSIDVDYSIVEPSPALHARLSLRTAQESETHHVLIANEVLDAQPVHRVVVRDSRLRELRVGVDASGSLTWIESDSVPHEVTAYFDRLGLMPPEHGVAEINTDLDRWFGTMSNRLERGLALVLDYGYTAEALLARPQGTLLTYWRHTLGSDPLVRLGQQDISAHVDFSSAAMAAQRTGLQVAGVTSPRALLRNLGLETLLPQLRDPADRRAVAQLMDANGLGRIGALLLTRGLDDYAPAGLHQRDWPPPTQVPTLPPGAGDRDFFDQWREAFPPSPLEGRGSG